MITASLGVAVLRIALAILLDTAALVVWDIGTRPPQRLVADIRRGIGQRRSLLRGSVRFATGALALVMAVAVTAPLVHEPRDLTIIGSWALVTALVLETLIGPDLRMER